jgi:replicative DNA helicase
MKNIENIKFWYNYFNETISDVAPSMKTSIKSIDDITGGIQKRNLYCIAGRVGMGCKHLLLQWIVDLSLNHNCLYISNKYPHNILIPHMDVYLKSMKNNSEQDVLSKDMLSLKLDYGYRTKYYLEDLLEEIKDKHAVNPFDILFLDDIQDIYMHNAPRYRDGELKKICIELKDLAMQLNIALIFTGKLIRSSDYRTYRKPSPIDIKESGAIESVSDVILVLNRPYYYDPEATDEDGCSLKNILLVSIYHSEFMEDIRLTTVFEENKIIDEVKAEELYNSFYEETPF